MKRSIIFLLIFVLLFSACSKSDNINSSIENNASVQSEGGVLENDFWRLSYSGEWEIDPASTLKSEGVFATGALFIPNGSDDAVYFYIEASVKDVSDYRAMITEAGYSSEHLQDNNTKYFEIDGIPFLSEEGSYQDKPMKCYYAREEAAKTTIIIRIIGDVEDIRINELLNSIEFNLKDIGNVDPPWPWEGNPISLPDNSIQIESLNLISHQLKLTDCIISDNIYLGRIAISDNYLYLLYGDKLFVYTYSGHDLVLQDNIDLEKEYKYISSCDNGMVYLSNYECDLIGFQNGIQTCSYNCPNYVVMHPSGDWGISFLTYNDVDKITFNENSYTEENWTFDEVAEITSIFISQNYILVSGESSEDASNKVFVYNTDGILQMVLGGIDPDSSDYLHSATSMVETDFGFLATDGFSRSIIAWDTSGNIIGKCDDEKIFGTDFPWMSTMDINSDGTVFIGMVEQREDQSASEFIIFSLISEN